MPRRSKVELSPETHQELENQFYSFLDSLTREETKKFFEEFLTTEEKMMMYKRLALYWMLFEGYSLASIQRSLGVTHDTTRLYNKRKNQMSDEFKNILHRIGRTVQAASTQEKMPEKQEIDNQTIDMTEEKIQESAQTNESAEEKNEEPAIMDEYIPAVETHEDETDTHEEGASEAETPKDVSEPESQEESIIVEPKETLQDVSVETHTEDVSSEEMEQKETTTEAQSEEANQQHAEPSDDVENNDDEKNDSGEKKKKGFGRFFGF